MSVTIRCNQFSNKTFLTASILDESGEMQSNSSTIKMENAGSAYYCNSYPLTSASSGIITDRPTVGSMVVSSNYSE